MSNLERLILVGDLIERVGGYEKGRIKGPHYIFIVDRLTQIHVI
jgi:hypothetical protein